LICHAPASEKISCGKGRRQRAGKGKRAIFAKIALNLAVLGEKRQANQRDSQCEKPL
jgi:hypothetical protein